MNYEKLIELALAGRSVNQASKDWNVPQSTLDKVCRGRVLPDYQTALILAAEAGVSAGEVMAICARKEAEKKQRVNLFFTGNTPEAAPALTVRDGTLCIM